MPPKASVAGDVFSVRQSIEEVVKPTLLRLEAGQREQATDIRALEDKVDALNIKFYGILGGGALGGVLAVGKTLGWF